MMKLDLSTGESRKYWKYDAPGKRFRQAKTHREINNERAMLLFDLSAVVSILGTAFARKLGCAIDEDKKQECIGIGESIYTTEERTTIKITLAGSLVYDFDVWVGNQVGQEAIIGMDVMIPA